MIVDTIDVVARRGRYVKFKSRTILAAAIS